MTFAERVLAIFGAGVVIYAVVVWLHIRSGR
jgi:hypothetical protein